MMELDRRSYLKTAGVAAAGTVGLAGCTGTASATGTLATQVTDQPGDIADFESCVVTIQGIWLKPTEGNDTTTTADSEMTESGSDDGTATETVVEQEEGDVDESDGREYHEFDEPQEADLVQLQDGNTDLIDERELDAGEYEFLQLDVTGVEGVLADGGDAQVDTPGGAPLQFKHPFEIREDQTTTFTGDFTPVRRGQTGRYLLQPVAGGTSVEYGDVTEDGS
jgi:hypothetical protein